MRHFTLRGLTRMRHYTFLIETIMRHPAVRAVTYIRYYAILPVVIIQRDYMILCIGYHLKFILYDVLYEIIVCLMFLAFFFA